MKRWKIPFSLVSAIAAAAYTIAQNPHDKGTWGVALGIVASSLSGGVTPKDGAR